MKINKDTLIELANKYVCDNQFDETAVDSFLFYLHNYFPKNCTKDMIAKWFLAEEAGALPCDQNQPKIIIKYSLAYPKLEKYIFENLNQKPKMKYTLAFVNAIKKTENGCGYWHIADRDLKEIFAKHGLSDLYETKMKPSKLGGTIRPTPDQIFAALEK